MTVSTDWAWTVKLCCGHVVQVIGGRRPLTNSLLTCRRCQFAAHAIEVTSTAMNPPASGENPST